MTSGPTSSAHLGEHLHNHPDAYWCADCHGFIFLDNWLLIYGAYDRQKRILEVCFNHGTRYQWRSVPRATAVALVRADDPAKYWNENIERQYRSAEVRGQYYTERQHPCFS